MLSILTWSATHEASPAPCWPRCWRRRAGAQAQNLRIGLAEDPDVLDPTLARTFVGRIVFAALCDKLFDIDEKLNIVPQLATSYEWSADSKALTIKLRPGVTFHDGEKLDAAAVKFNLERHKTMPGSQPPRRAGAGDQRRRGRPDDRAAEPDRAVLAAARGADRPRRHDGLARRPRRPPATSSAPKPVCSGPFKFVERVAQDRIVLERYRRTTGTRARSTSTRSPTRRSPTPRCAWPT